MKLKTDEEELICLTTANQLKPFGRSSIETFWQKVDDHLSQSTQVSINVYLSINVAPVWCRRPLMRRSSFYRAGKGDQQERPKIVGKISGKRAVRTWNIAILLKKITALLSLCVC